MIRSLADLKGNAPFVVAHRGGALEAPENTLQAFRRAAKRKFPWAECDVRALADGTPVVIHDAEAVLRGAAARVPVSGLRASDLARIDLGAMHGTPAKGESPPLLHDLLRIDWGATRLMIEIKPTDHDAALGAAVAKLAASQMGPERCVVASFSHTVLRAAAEAAPELLRMALLDAETPAANFASVTVAAFGVDRTLVNRSLVADLSAKGAAVWSWTVRRIDEVKPLVEAGVQGLITDHPTAVADHLSRTRGSEVG